MKGDVQKELWFREAQQVLEDNQVSRAADGEKFCQALYEAQDY